MRARRAVGVPLSRLRRQLPAAQWARLRVIATRLPTAPLRAEPSFFVLGAQRGGTTALYGALSAHPQVVPAAMKEIHHFDAPRLWPDATYRAFFPLRSELDAASARSAPALTGEASPTYLLDPRVPDLIAARYPHARFVVLLREPVARAWSHYCMARKAGWVEGRSFREELARPLIAPDARRRGLDHWRAPWFRTYYVERGRYAEQLRRWLARYPRTSFLILRSEDWFADPRSTFAEVAGFLGIDPGFVPAFGDRNSAQGPPMPEADRAWLAEQYEVPNRELRDLVGIGWE